MVRNPDHITIAVRDVPAAVAYFALLGFREDHVTTIDGGVPAQYMGMPDMKAEHVTLGLDGSDPRFEIQLLCFDDDALASVGTQEASNHRRIGFNHLALRVDDLDATSAHLTANGVPRINEPMAFIGRKLEFFAGPEGVTIELVEWLPTDA